MPESESRLKNLMLLSLGGDGMAYRELLLKLSVRLRAYYRKRLGAGCSDAEDLVQETLIAIHARRATFDRRRLFTPWAYAMARYKLVDYLRRSRVRVSVSMDDCAEFFAMDETEQELRPTSQRALWKGLVVALSVGLVVALGAAWVSFGLGKDHVSMLLTSSLWMKWAYALG